MGAGLRRSPRGGEQTIVAHINGVRLAPRRIISDNRGAVAHFMKESDPEFKHFGEVYFSIVRRGAVKAWHLHKWMTLNYICFLGEVIVGLYDNRPSSPTAGMAEQVLLSSQTEETHVLLTIPPFVWNGYRAAPGFSQAGIANFATMPHDPTEIERASIDDICPEFDWGEYDISG